MSGRWPDRVLGHCCVLTGEVILLRTGLVDDLKVSVLEEVDPGSTAHTTLSVTVIIKILRVVRLLLPAGRSLLNPHTILYFGRDRYSLLELLWFRLLELVHGACRLLGGTFSNCNCVVVLAGSSVADLLLAVCGL